MQQKRSLASFRQNAAVKATKPALPTRLWLLLTGRRIASVNGVSTGQVRWCFIANDDPTAGPGKVRPVVVAKSRKGTATVHYFTSVDKSGRPGYVAIKAKEQRRYGLDDEPGWVSIRPKEVRHEDFDGPVISLEGRRILARLK